MSLKFGRRLYSSISTYKNAKNLDLAFCVDLTKSMGPFIDATQRNFDYILGDIMKNQISLRFGMIGFRDW